MGHGRHSKEANRVAAVCKGRTQAMAPERQRSGQGLDLLHGVMGGTRSHLFQEDPVGCWCQLIRAQESRLPDSAQ